MNGIARGLESRGLLGGFPRATAESLATAVEQNVVQQHAGSSVAPALSQAVWAALHPILERCLRQVGLDPNAPDVEASIRILKAGLDPTADPGQLAEEIERFVATVAAQQHAGSAFTVAAPEPPMPAPVVVPTETFHTSLATAETASAAPPPLLAPEQTEAAMSTANALRVVVRMIDLDGQPLADATFCVFKPGVAPLPGQIRRQDVLLLRRTNSGGLFDSDQIGTRLAPGIYRVKAVHHDYASFETEMLLSEGSTPGIGVLTFRLAPENQ